MNFDWTPDRVEHLRRRCAEGASSREVAGELKTTRNTVIAAARRRGFAWGRSSRRFGGTAPKPVEPPRATVLDRGGVKSRIRPGLPVEVALLDDVLAMRPSEGVALHDLRRTQCRWLLGSGAPWAFCGEPAVEKKAYCAEHARRVYVPPKREEKR